MKLACQTWWLPPKSLPCPAEMSLYFTLNNEGYVVLSSPPCHSANLHVLRSSSRPWLVQDGAYGVTGEEEPQLCGGLEMQWVSHGRPTEMIAALMTKTLQTTPTPSIQKLVSPQHDEQRSSCSQQKTLQWTQKPELALQSHPIAHAFAMSLEFTNLVPFCACWTTRVRGRWEERAKNLTRLLRSYILKAPCLNMGLIGLSGCDLAKGCRRNRDTVATSISQGSCFFFNFFSAFSVLFSLL